MVGEVRDEETARIMIEAALTGHMVLTHHPHQRCRGRARRLTEMGVEPFLTASAVDCVVAQRLARGLCAQCKRRTVIPRQADRGRLPGRRDREKYQSAGCAPCRQTGYRGRLGMYEVLPMSEEIERLTAAALSASEIAARPARRACGPCARTACKRSSTGSPRSRKSPGSRPSWH